MAKYKKGHQHVQQPVIIPQVKVIPWREKVSLYVVGIFITLTIYGWVNNLTTKKDSGSYPMHVITIDSFATRVKMYH